jgi:hypothetical protein
MGLSNLRWNYSPLKRKGRLVAGWPFSFWEMIFTANFVEPPEKNQSAALKASLAFHQLALA